MCVCVCVCILESKRERDSVSKSERGTVYIFSKKYFSFFLQNVNWIFILGLIFLLIFGFLFGFLRIIGLQIIFIFIFIFSLLILLSYGSFSDVFYLYFIELLTRFTYWNIFSTIRHLSGLCCLYVRSLLGDLYNWSCYLLTVILHYFFSYHIFCHPNIVTFPILFLVVVLFWRIFTFGSTILILSFLHSSSFYLSIFIYSVYFTIISKLHSVTNIGVHILKFFQLPP